MNNKVYVTTNYSVSRAVLVTQALSNAEELFDNIIIGTIVIKPNFLSYRNLGASTHPDTLRAVVEFFRNKYPHNRIVVAEGSHVVDEYVQHYNIIEMLATYNAEFLSLNSEENEWVTFSLSALDGKNLITNFSKTLFDAGLLVSLCVPKTHANIGLTSSMKNMVGGIKKEERCHMHGLYNMMNKKILKEHKKTIYDLDSVVGNIAINLRKKIPIGKKKKKSIREERDILTSNLKKMYYFRKPDFGVVDGYTAMEGNGPWHGKVVDLRTVFISKDVVAVDTCIAQYTKLPIEYLGYITEEVFSDFEVQKFGDIFREREFIPHFFYADKEHF